MSSGMRPSVLLTTLVAALALCTQAQAATVAARPSEIELGGPPVTFTAASGEVNRLTVSSIPGAPDQVVFSDAGASIAGPPSRHRRRSGRCARQPAAGVTIG